MHPTVKDMILAHPLPFFLFWLPVVLYLGIPINRDWYSLEPGVQLTAAAVFALWGIPTLLSLPKVWWHLYQKRKASRAGIDPELILTRRRTRQRWTLALLAVATFEYALSWISGHSFAEDGNHYLTALVIAGSLGLLPFVLFYRLTRTWRSYLFLALLSIAGGAGLWQLAEHPQFLTEHPELSLYLPLTAALGAFLPPLLIVVTLLLRGFARLRGFSLPQAAQAKDKPFAVTWCLPALAQARHRPRLVKSSLRKVLSQPLHCAVPRSFFVTAISYLLNPYPVSYSRCGRANVIKIGALAT